MNEFAEKLLAAFVAQLVEHTAVNRSVHGSIPCRSEILYTHNNSNTYYVHCSNFTFLKNLRISYKT